MRGLLRAPVRGGMSLGFLGWRRDGFMVVWKDFRRRLGTPVWRVKWLVIWKGCLVDMREDMSSCEDRVSSMIRRRSQWGSRRAFVFMCSGRMIQRIGLDRVRGVTLWDLICLRRDGRVFESEREKRWMLASGILDGQAR